MRSIKNIIIYALVIAGFSSLVYYISVKGEKLNTKAAAVSVSEKGPLGRFR